MPIISQITSSQNFETVIPFGLVEWSFNYVSWDNLYYKCFKTKSKDTVYAGYQEDVSAYSKDN